MRSRTHRAAAALRARSARVPPPQHREGIGPTPTNRRNHTSARPQHVHTGRREGREATGGYAHRCEVVAPLVLASGRARTCRARREPKAAAAAPRGRAVPIHLTGPTQLGLAHGRSAGTGWAGESPCGWRRTAGSPPWAHDVGACLQPRSRRQGPGRAAPSRSPWRRAAGALGTRPARTHRPGVRRPGLSVRGAWGRPEHRRGGRGYGAGQHIAAGCSLSAGSAARRAAAGALRSRRPSCSGSPSGGATPPARCGQGRAPRRPRSRRSRSSSSGAANGRPQNAGGGRALPRRRASCTYLSRL